MKALPRGNEGAAFEVREGGFVGRDHAGARAAFDGHVADGHAAVHGEFADGLAAVFGDVAGAAADADFSDDGENDVFGGDAVGALAVDHDVQVLERDCDQALGGEHVLDFAGADAEGQRAERAVRGSVAVAADDGLAGLGDAQLRADDVHDALIFAVHVEQTHAGFAAIFFEGVELELGVLVENGQGAVGGGNGMVHHREGEIGAANLAAFGAKTGEGLRRGAFVNEVAVNIDDGRLAGLFANYVGVPDFLVEGFGWHSDSQMILAPQDAAG